MDSIHSKKCNWVRKNIDIEAYGKKDKFSYDLCIITEQNSLISELFSLVKDEGNPFFAQKNKYSMKLIEQKEKNFVLTMDYPLNKAIVSNASFLINLSPRDITSL